MYILVNFAKLPMLVITLMLVISTINGIVAVIKYNHKEVASNESKILS